MGDSSDVVGRTQLARRGLAADSSDVRGSLTLGTQATLSRVRGWDRGKGSRPGLRQQACLQMG